MTKFNDCFLKFQLFSAVAIVATTVAAATVQAAGITGGTENRTSAKSFLIERTGAARSALADPTLTDDDSTRPISVSGVVPMRVDVGVFRDAAEAARSSTNRRLQTEQVVSLPLVDGTSVNAIVTESEVTASGSTMMSGFIEGDSASSFDFLLTSAGILTGAAEFTSSNGETHVYRTRRHTDGTQLFERIELDLSRSADDGVQLPNTTDDDVRRSLDLARIARSKAAEEDTSARRLGAQANGDANVVDLMVMYSAKSIQRFGGLPATKAAIEFAVEKTNRGWRRSGIKTRVRLVYSSRLVGFADSGTFDFTRLTYNGDGLVDYIHPLRRRKGADLVMIIGNSMRLPSGTSVCGLGYYPNNRDPNGDIVGFSYVATDCVVGALTFSHEIGHNLGARHDRATDGYVGSRYSNFGYITPSKRYRTVMAYSAPCGSSICPRLNFWSNPKLRFNGEPLGVATPANRSANNARELNRSTGRVSRYRSEILRSRPAISSPRNNTWINANNATVYFEANGTQNITGWRVTAGSRSGARNYYDSGVLPAGVRKLKVNRLPSDGTRVHITLQYRVGAAWRRVPHVFRSLRAPVVTVLDEIQPLREYLNILPSFVFSSSADQRYLQNRLNVLERVALVNNVDLMEAVERQFRQRVNGCGDSPDIDDTVLSCRAQKEIQVYSRSIITAIRQL